jgi:hypothetical protein
MWLNPLLMLDDNSPSENDSHVTVGRLLGRELTLRRNSPLSRSTELRAMWGPSQSASASPIVATVPSGARRNVVFAEQASHNQKYSVSLPFDDWNRDSVSNRNSLPPARRRNETEHEGFVHLASIAIPHGLKRRPAPTPVRGCTGSSGVIRQRLRQ